MAHGVHFGTYSQLNLLQKTDYILPATFSRFPYTVCSTICEFLLLYIAYIMYLLLLLKRGQG